MNYSGLTGKVVTRFDEEYDVLRKDYNLAINKFPLAIVYCYNSQDVSNAIRWCRKHDVDIRIRTHGHNYEAYSIGNDVLVIDTSLMNKIEIDTRRDTAKIEAGANLRQVYSMLADRGYGFPGGTCPTVGISGLVLGGGIGLSSRRFGLVTDNLLELEIVNAEGKLLVANQYRNSDLFWACRGAGGGNFGVVVSYTFSVFKAEKVTLIQLRWSPEARVEFLALWQHWLRTADRRISCFAGFNGTGIYLNSFFYGTEKEARRILRDFLLLPGLSPNSVIKSVPFIEAVNAIGAMYGPPMRFKSTGRFVYKTLSRKTIQRLVRHVDNSPDKSSCRISIYTLGGAVKDMASSETAFYYRNARYIMAITADWDKGENPDIYRRWVAEGFDFIESFTNGSYVNFPYRELEDYQHEYYGENIYKLKRVKRIYDPHNIFRFQQSIR